MKLLEVVRGAQTAPAVLDAALALGKRMGKVSVVAGIHQRLMTLETRQGDHWRPARLIGELAGMGKGFADR